MAWWWTASRPIDMRTLWRIAVRTVFWSYERGTWPYDVAVGAIVLFVLLTPRSWFHDQPQVGPPLSVAEVQLLTEDAANGVKVYRIDARLIVSPARTPQFDREVHDILRKNISELKGKSFEIQRVDAVRGGDGTIIDYDISIKP
jgi:hypothetical protein